MLLWTKEEITNKVATATFFKLCLPCTCESIHILFCSRIEQSGKAVKAEQELRGSPNEIKTFIHIHLHLFVELTVLCETIPSSKGLWRTSRYSVTPMISNVHLFLSQLLYTAEIIYGCCMCIHVHVHVSIH